VDSQERRRELRLQYGELFDAVAAVLFAADPIGINFGDNTDEYHPDVSTILPKLRGCESAADVQQLLYREFVAWFDEGIASPEAKYLGPARAIWELWQRHHGYRSLV
jgi:hypothetical protein